MQNSPPKQFKVQKFFVKDGDDKYTSRRPRPRQNVTNAPPRVYSTCTCGGKLKPRGATGMCFTSCDSKYIVIAADSRLDDLRFSP